MNHTPVLLKEVIAFLDPAPGKRYIDATYGMGGHAKEIVKGGGIVLGIDRDPQTAVILEGRSPDRISRDSIAPLQNDKLRIVAGNFKDIKEIAEEHGFAEVDGILFDLGLGSHQLDDPERGFSFQKAGPLDMRFDKSEARNSKSETAESIVNQFSEKDLYRIFRDYGEEKRWGKRVARAILEARKTGSVETTDQLFELIKKALPAKFRFRAGDTARRIFQSLRIEVNDELGALEKALPQALELLKGGKGSKGGGKLVVISFHSLEDRIVKSFFQKEARNCVCPPEFPVCRCDARATLRISTKKPVTASAEEIAGNRRAQSAKLRVAQKL
ncbi:MAG: 16S rRNA (cytosine(1402)-N(4))-methyltransferase RsmH [Candidatus Doudnabacteria bacterium]|nr:16S rRNA (cytosine(1402)-N(4))-methyltransferase RsmH [Candidatus Doudnabacteria bacterium]